MRVASQLHMGSSMTNHTFSTISHEALDTITGGAKAGASSTAAKQKPENVGQDALSGLFKGLAGGVGSSPDKAFLGGLLGAGKAALDGFGKQNGMKSSQ